jgi:hypothetical protein
MSATQEEKVDEIEVIEPSYSIKHRTIGGEEHIQVYAQKPLSFFGKMELFSLLGSAVDKALKDGDVSVSDLFDRPQVRDLSSISANEVKEADLFVKAVAKLVEFAPDFLKDLYCVILAIPKGEREYAKMLMEAPEDEGGLSDDEGIDILNTFIDQNWEAMVDFFGKKIMPLAQKVSSKAQDTASSKPSKVSARRTRKR